jgi:two-component system, OmpR family, KDP operon response regulator KdpE
VNESTVLLIEDEPQIRRFVRLALEAEGCRVYEAENGRRGLIEAGTRKPDVIVLDLGLPDMDGINVIRELRAWSTVPIVVLSARAQEAEKITALDLGADDYLTKPFGTGELLARLRVVLRRRSPAEAVPEVRFGDVKVDFANRRVFLREQEVHLTAIEYRLLAGLIRNSGKVLTHRQLLKEVWGPSHIEDSHYLRTYMAHLRQKLEVDPAQPKHLITETGVGYRLVE